MSKTSPDFYDDVKALRREVRALKASNTITTTINRIFPVGSLYITATDNNPATQLGGEWQPITSTVPDVYFWRRTA